jgi:hypothetical protein
MSITTITRLAAATGAGLALSVTAALPAMAKVPPEPDHPTVVYYDREVPVVRDDGFDLTAAAAGALSGIALAGAGLGAAALVHRRRDHMAAQPA